jgi:hypothetical protein
MRKFGEGEILALTLRWRARAKRFMRAAEETGDPRDIARLAGMLLRSNMLRGICAPRRNLMRMRFRLALAATLSRNVARPTCCWRMIPRKANAYSGADYAAAADLCRVRCADV